MPALREVQAAFGCALLGGDDGGLAALVAEDGIAASERLALHRNNVLISLTDVLRDTFPVVCRLVDERFFAYAAHEFLTANPPQRACLAEYGAGFADFLAAFPPCRELVYLPDVARLEWLLHAAAHAADGESLLPSSLAAVAAAEAPRLRFRLAPSLGFLASPWPVDRIWRANEPGSGSDEVVDLAAGGVHLEVGRSDGDVMFRTLDVASFAFRQALAGGVALDAAVAAAFAADPQFDLAVAIAALFRDGAVVSFTLVQEAVP